MPLKLPHLDCLSMLDWLYRAHRINLVDGLPDRKVPEVEGRSREAEQEM